MDADASPLLPALASAGVSACGLLLALLCLRCRDNGPPVSIRETSNTGEYIPSTQFRLVRSHQSMTSGLLSPFIPTTDGGSHCSRISDQEPTESESNHSYQNSHDGQSRLNSFTEQDFPESLTSDYIIVLPGDEAANHSGASTPSTGEPHYENVQCEQEQRSPTDNSDYLNVIPFPPEEETPKLSSESEEDDSDDGEGKYVNQASVSAVELLELADWRAHQVMSVGPLHDGTGRAWPVADEKVHFV